MNTNLGTGRLLRIAAAVTILVSGVVHLDLYYNAYRGPSQQLPNFGRSLLLNVISSGVIAIALVARKEWFIRAAGIGFAVSTIAVFAYIHSGHTLFKFSSEGEAPSPQAQIAMIAQILTIVLLAATFLPAIDKPVGKTPEAPLGMAYIGAAAVIVIVVLVGYTLRWRTQDASVTTIASAPTATTAVATNASTVTTAAGPAAPAPTAVSIKDFAFVGKTISVTKGSTVTWTNNDSVGHSVVSNDKTTFKSQKLTQGQTFSFTFSADGTFAYICGIHPYMAGTITVTG